MFCVFLWSSPIQGVHDSFLCIYLLFLFIYYLFIFIYLLICLFIYYILLFAYYSGILTYYNSGAFKWNRYDPGDPLNITLAFFDVLLSTGIVALCCYSLWRFNFMRCRQHICCHQHRVTWHSTLPASLDTLRWFISFFILIFLILGILLRLSSYILFHKLDPTPFWGQFVNPQRIWLQTSAEYYIMSLAALLLWVRLIFYCVHIPSIHYFCHVMHAARYDLFAFMCCVFMAVLAFGHAGYIVFHGSVSRFRSLQLSWVNLMWSLTEELGVFLSSSC